MSSKGDSQSSLGRYARQGEPVSQLDMLTGLLKKEQRRGSSECAGQLLGSFSESVQKPLLEISQSPKMNLFKVGGGGQENLGGSFRETLKEGQSRHINLEKNDYLNKLLNEIKKSQVINSEKTGREDQEEVFNDTFGQGGPDPENKENLTPTSNKVGKPVEKGTQSSPQSRKTGIKVNVFKQMKKCQTERVYEKIGAQKTNASMQGPVGSPGVQMRGKSVFEKLAKAKMGRKCGAREESHGKRRPIKRGSKAKKMRSLKFGDSRREKMSA